MIIIPSVPHTGTMFTVSLFTAKGYNQNSLVDVEVPDRCVRSGHIVKAGMYNRAIDFIRDGYVAVIPVRHPYLVAESWRRRGKDLGEMMDAYRKLPLLQDMGALPLPVDVDRDRYIAAIRVHTGVPVVDSRKVINSKCGTAELSYHAIDPDVAIREFANEMGEFLAQFYGD